MKVLVHLAQKYLLLFLLVFGLTGCVDRPPPTGALNKPTSAESLALTEQMWTYVNGEKRPTYPDKVVHFVIPFEETPVYWKAKLSLAHFDYDEPNSRWNFATPSDSDQPFSLSGYHFAAVLPGNKPLHWIGGDRTILGVWEPSADGKTRTLHEKINRASFVIKPCESREEKLKSQEIPSNHSSYDEYDVDREFEIMRANEIAFAQRQSARAPEALQIKAFAAIPHQCLSRGGFCLLKPRGYPSLMLSFSGSDPKAELNHIRGYFKIVDPQLGIGCGKLFAYSKQMGEIVSFYQTGIDLFQKNVVRPIN